MKLGFHLVLFAIAASSAIFVWTREPHPVAPIGDVTIWNVASKDVERVVFETKGSRLTLEAHSDSVGTFFLCTFDPSASSAAKPVTFVSVGPAEKLMAALAPLKAVREIGKIPEGRASEFGLTYPEGSLSIIVDDSHRSQRTLQLGAAIPGGGGRYVREAEAGVVYALKADVVRDLEAGEPVLAEHDLHAFKDSEVRSARVLEVATGKKRDVVRGGGEGKRFWADASTPDTADETFSNWIAMVDRLRPVEWSAGRGEGIVPLVRVEVQAKGGAGAFVEVAKVPGTNGPDFLVRSERTRLWAKTLGAVGEQIDRDLAAVVR